MSNACVNFVANVFDRNKCQNCFKSRDNHAGISAKNLKNVRKVVGCGYLFISPQGLDFRNVLDRSKRWQRRFFTLHDDGELLFSIDENSETIPQGHIRLENCRSVHGGEAITGHANSIALHLDNGESYFLRAANREEMLYWEKLLSAFSQVSKRISPRFQKFPRSKSGPIATQPQPPPRQQPPKPQKKPETSPSNGTTHVIGKQGDYYETDLDYDLNGPSGAVTTDSSARSTAVIHRHYTGSTSSKSANTSPFVSKPSDSGRLRRRPMSVGDQLKNLIRMTSDHSPEEKISDGKELTYLKKGWLFTKGPTDSKLQKRWCVLSDGILGLFRDAAAEEQQCPDYTLPLFMERNTVTLNENSSESTYGFTLEMSNGVYSFTAMTAGIRSNWLQALHTCLKMRNGPGVARHSSTSRRHTTTITVPSGPSSETLGSDVCDAEVSQILNMKTKFDETKTNSVPERGYNASKTSINSSISRSSQLNDSASASARSDRNVELVDLYTRLAESESEANSLRKRVSELTEQLEKAHDLSAELESRLSDREAECRDLSDQCQRLELDVFEREKLVTLPTDDELKLKQQLAAHDEALRASQERCLRAERCVGAINDRLAESLSAADEELADAIQQRDEALKEKAAAIDDRDAIDRRWKTERAHWQDALQQNELENTRLEAERKRLEKLLQTTQAQVRELEAEVGRRRSLTLSDFRLPEHLADDVNTGWTVEVLVSEWQRLKNSYSHAKASVEERVAEVEAYRDLMEEQMSELREELNKSMKCLAQFSPHGADAVATVTEDEDAMPAFVAALEDVRSSCEEVMREVEVGPPCLSGDMKTIFYNYLAPEYRQVVEKEFELRTEADEDRKQKLMEEMNDCRRRLNLLISHCSVLLSRRKQESDDLASGFNSYNDLDVSLENMRRLISCDISLTKPLAQIAFLYLAISAMRNRQSSGSLPKERQWESVVAALRSYCRQELLSVVRHLSHETNDTFKIGDLVNLSKHLLIRSSVQCLEKCFGAFEQLQKLCHMSVPFESALTHELDLLFSGISEEHYLDDQDISSNPDTWISSLLNVPFMVIVLSLLDSEHGDKLETQTVKQLSDLRLAEDEWVNLSLLSLASHLEETRVLPLRSQLEAVEQEIQSLDTKRETIECLQQEISEKDREITRLSDLCSRLESESDAFKDQIEDLERTEKITEPKTAAISIATQTKLHNPSTSKSNGAHEYEETDKLSLDEDSVDYWKNELKKIFETQLSRPRAMSDSVVKKEESSNPDIDSLQMQIEEERARHKEEIADLRKQYETAMEQETLATKLAIEAIKRSYDEKLEAECQTFKESQMNLRWLTESPAYDDHLTILARRIARLPSQSGGDVFFEEDQDDASC